MIIEHADHGLYATISNVDFNGLFMNDAGSGVTFTGNNATFTASFFSGIGSDSLLSLSGTTNVTFINCSFKSGYNLVSVNSANNVVFSNCSFEAGSTQVSINGATKVTLTNCSFGSGDVAVSFSSALDLVVQQCSFTANSIGINSQQSTDVEVFDCSFIANNRGIQLSMPWSSVTASFDVIENMFDGNGFSISAEIRQNCKLNITNNIFKNAPEWLNYGTSGVYATLYGDCTFNVLSNEFSNLRYNGLQIVRSYEYSLAKVWVTGNSFHNISSTVLTMTNAGSTITSIENNKFTWNICQRCSSAMSLTLNTPYDGYWRGIRGYLTVAYNQFSENSGSYVVNVNMYPATVTPGPDFSDLQFIYNILADNIADSAVMYSEYYLLDVVFNILSNPKSTFEFAVGFTGNLNENCTYNWWHAIDSAGVKNRILDQATDTSRGSAVYEPFLNSSQFSCAGVSDCSHHGSCILPDTCRCDDGWKGSDCSQVSCSGVKECSSHGVCSGPNICQCIDGWSSADCSIPTCYLLRNCTSPTHGICIASNQ